MVSTRWILIAWLVAPLGAVAAEAPARDAAAIEFFEKKIRPILVENCHTCHSADTNSKSGLRVDDRNGLVNGGERGAAIVPGNPAESLLLKAVNHVDDDLKMPPGKKLTDEQIADLTTWIQNGAAWPAADLHDDASASHADYERLRREHWAWQPLRSVAAPVVRDASWALGDVDAFVLSRLEASKLSPAGDADRWTWIRRVTFDLTGLPPSPAEVDAFLADTSLDAFEKVVDRLLASPAYGERWGRHWLDVTRYGESTGSSRNLPYPHAWRYRDYVIDAFNADVPYDQFIREQIAGDLLPADSQEERDRQRIATGFLALGVKDVNQRFKVRFVMDNIDEQIDAVTRSFLALTASCARCHDHKFDPIPTADYYALAGIFHSTDLCAGVRNKMGGGGLDYYDPQMILRIGSESETFEPSPEAAQKIEELKQEVATARQEFQALRGKPEGNEPGPDGRPKRAIARQNLNRLQAELVALSDPVANGGPAAFGVREATHVGDTEIRIRGEAERLGPVAPRGFLSVVKVADAPSIDAGHSGRLELAAWLTNPRNPLPARVIVNRVWGHLFGEGVVKSVDNFGINGDVPSHPELLDYLAAQFVREGWSIKKLVRSLVLTRAYRLSADAKAEYLAVDPDNRLIWRHSPRRLDAEELRDSVLVAAGRLNLARPDASPAKELQVLELRNNGPEALKLLATAAGSTHRSVYLPLLRGITPRALEVFDFADQGMVTGKRDTTTVATQALYQLNDPFIRGEALRLAEQLLEQTSEDAERVARAYRLALSRTPTAQEVERALGYLSDYEANAGQWLASLTASSPQHQLAASDPGESTGDAAETKKKPQNPDGADPTDTSTAEVQVIPSSARAAAWASFCQALFGSAEFRYLK